MRLIDDSVVSKIMSRGDGKATIVVCGGRLFQRNVICYWVASVGEIMSHGGAVTPKGLW